MCEEDGPARTLALACRRLRDSQVAYDDSRAIVDLRPLADTLMAAAELVDWATDAPPNEKARAISDTGRGE
jgi:hypothetical protein